jgi:hypothetical protein
LAIAERGLGEWGDVELGLGGWLDGVDSDWLDGLSPPGTAATAVESSRQTAGPAAHGADWREAMVAPAADTRGGAVHVRIPEVSPAGPDSRRP